MHLPKSARRRPTKESMRRSRRIALRNSSEYYASDANGALDDAFFARLLSDELVKNAVLDHPQ